MLEIRCLGPIEVLIDDQLVSIGGPRPRALLAALALHHGNPVMVERLIDNIWGERPPRTAAKTLQKYVSELRRVLADVVATRPGAYVLETDCDVFDVCRFDRAIDSAATLPPDRAFTVLETALADWRGDPFPELVDAIDAQAERTRLIEQRLEAEERLIQAQLNLGQHASVVGRLEELVATQPLREHLWSLLMLALYRNGRQADALRAFQRLVEHLADIGLEPAPATRMLEQEILLQDPELAPPEPTVPTTNLPVRGTSFIGRTTEVETLAELTRANRVVTLLGTGGSGKTRLAIEVARREVGAVADGVWFIDLAPLTSPDEIPKAFADPLGIGSHGSRPIVEVLLDVLAKRETLIVLDNCEHIIGDVARLATRILERAPELRILATSREPLGVDGELTFDVPALPVPTGTTAAEVGASEAAMLFVDRARHLDLGFALGASNAAAVAEICRRLDGIPLAIELAAARIRTYTPTEIAQLLDDRFSLLESPIRDGTARHRTLQAAVAWSYGALDDHESALFTRLAVFRGSFDREAVARICSTAPLAVDSIVTLLPRLVDRSLVVVEHSGTASRYRLLETLREYGWNQLSGDEQTFLRDNHAAHYCELAESVAPLLRSAGQEEWIVRLKEDYGNLRRALRWAFSHNREMGVRLAIALAILWDAVGPRTEAQEWIGRAVELTDGELRRFYIDARLVAADLFMSTRVSHTVRYAEEAIAEARRTGDRRGEAGGLRALGWARALEDDFAEGVEVGERALAIWRDIGDPWETAWSLERLGESDYLDAERALALLEESLDLFQEVGDHRRAAMVMYKIAETAMRSGGDLERPEEYVEASLNVFERMGSIHDSAHALLELGRIRRRLGDPEAAARALETGLDRMRLVGDRRCEARTLAALGTALIDTREPEAAWERLTDTLRLARDIGERQMVRVALAGMGRISAQHGRLSEATVLTAAAERIGSDLGIPASESSRRSRAARLDDLRTQLGDRTFDAAWSDGFSMTTVGAIDRALASSFPGN